MNLAGPGTFTGPRRYIEYTKPIELFYQYQGFAESRQEKAASFSTFLRIMRPIFKTHIKCRDKGEHGQCDTCYKLRSAIKRAGSKEAKANLVRSYSRHLLSQWLDRTTYWHLRAQSRAFFAESLHLAGKLMASSTSASVLALIQDGMDQSKLRLPRPGYRQSSKAWQKIFRPACHLVGTWIHGFKLALSLSDEDLKKDSQTSIELIARALSEVVDSFGVVPLQIHLQQDNCAREGKNQFMLSFFLLLTTLGVCKYASLGFCRVGHSHEDIDQAFGQISRILQGKKISTPCEMIAMLNDLMGAERDGRIRGSRACALKVDETCCWKAFCKQAGVSFKGMRRVHYMRFCARKDLGTDVLDHVLRLEEIGRGCLPHPGDIMLVTKRWLADTEVQRAIAVVPAAAVEQIRAGFHPPGGLAPRRVIREQIRKNIERGVPPVTRTGEMTQEGAHYLLQWSQGALPRCPRPEQYSILNYRYSPELRRPHAPGTWTLPRRIRHFDLALDQEGDADLSNESGSDDEEALGLPVGLD